jgi:uncharacterized protein (DUF2235 family)
MAKNIVLCCDGTANEFAQDKTNVIKLFSALEQSDEQVTYYHPGLGTMEAPGALTPWARRISTTFGLAFGSGLDRDIRDAYVFLMRTYVPGDRVFLFGFSRGAYTVRAVAAMLHQYGLIRPNNESFVAYAVRMLLAIHRAEERSSPRVHEYFQLADEFRKTMMWTSCPVAFVGVWDTVSSVGWIENPLHLPYVSNNPDIAVARHAVAIDERRAFFRTELWRPKADPAATGPKDLKQVWFPGVHCDVGGGYPEPESSLSKIPLGWMLREAKQQGLLVNDAKEKTVMGQVAAAAYVAPDCNGPIHESLTGWWKPAEFIPRRRYDWNTGQYVRRANQSARRFIPPGSLVHPCAYERAGDYAKRLPPDAVRGD